MSSRGDPCAPGSRRRRATVTIYVPEASSDRSMSSRDRKPPVPTIRREAKLLPPSSNASAAPFWSATLHRRHDLHGLALAKRGRLPLAARDDLAVPPPRHSRRRCPTGELNGCHHERSALKLMRFAVHLDDHSSAPAAVNRPGAKGSRPGGSSSPAAHAAAPSAVRGACRTPFR